MKNKYILLIILSCLSSYLGYGQTTLYSEDFESKTQATIATGAGTEGWKSISTTGTVNKWAFSSTSPLSGSKSLTIYNTNNTTYCSYDNTIETDQIVYYGTLINAANYGDVKMNFKWKCTGESGYDFGKVVYSLDGTTWVDVVSTEYEGQSTSQTVSNLSLPSATNHASFYIGFQWICDNSVGSTPPFTIDDLSITGVEGLSAIGTATTAEQYQPFYSYYGYGRAADLYTSAEIGATGTITNLKFYVSTADATSVPVKIYLKSTTATSVASDTWANTISGATLVYDASVGFSATGWQNFDITDFTYSSNNLMVLCEANYGGTGQASYPYFYYSAGAANQNAIWYQDNSAPTSTPTAFNTKRPNIQIYFSTSAAPTVTTTAISAITPTAATSGGNITSIGSASVTVSGICWNTSTNPTTANSKTTDGATSATSFSSNLSSLSAQTYYYVRAYATNSVGTSYGSNVEFYTYSTEPTGHSATFTASVASSSQIDLTFSPASSYGADGYIILRLAGATPPDNTNINDGTAPGSLTMPGSTVLVTTITSDATTSYSSTGLSGSTQYSYAIIPYNWDGSNAGTYNYRTSATIPTCNGTTTEGPSSEGFVVAGNVVMNGTFDQTDDENYFAMSGTAKSITGSGTYTNVKLNVNGTITFDGTISSGSFSKTFVTSAKTFTLNTNKTYVNGLFTNQGTATLNSGSTFQNSGNWLNYGTITANSTSTATFNGGSAQTIGGTAVTTFYNTTIANTSGGVALGINSTVQNTLTLTSGKFTIQGYTLTIGTTSANGSVSGGSPSTYIVAYDNAGTIGYLKEFVNANAAYSYPIGDAANYTPLTFTLTANGGLASAYITVYTKDVKVPGLNGDIVAYLDRYWDVTESGFTTPTYTMSYTYVDADLVGSESGMLPIKKSGSTWYKPIGSSFTDGTEQGTGSFNAGTNTLTWSGLTTFSGFGGVPDGVVPLPVSLVVFKGEKDGKNNKLLWETSTEMNNDFFTIEKTMDGENYAIVGTEDGAGTSNEHISYSLIDYDVREVLNYYRLKQTDFDGKYTFSEVITIDNRSNVVNKEVVMMTNILGQEVNEFYRGIVVILYSDGTSVKVIQ